ncbi:MAG: hypothetical protein II936_09465 [Oscillospiraceae bacterium]|nr:hypothetical protein [Oscillospiraceae bacterium]
MGKETLVPDEMPEKAHKSIHNVTFVFVTLIVGVALFFISQAVFYVFVVDDEERAEMFSGGGSDSSVTLDKYLGHDYCSTFYVWLTVGNNYGTVENFEAAGNVNRAVGGVVDNTIVTAAPILFFICMFIAFRKADKKRFFGQSGWQLIMTAGIALLIKNIWTIIKQIYILNAEQPYVTGIFENRRYYFQIYHYLGIPALVIMTALITGQHSLNIQKRSADGNTKALIALAAVMGIVSAGFMLLRLVTRIYEIVCSKTHDAMLPFYSDLLTFPRELAESPEVYRGLLIFRLLKDLPVFISSTVTVILLIKIMLSSARNEINTQENMKRFNICMAVLFISSLIYNILGLHEVNVLNHHFSGIYGSVIYTIGLRALCDPTLYAVILWFVKTFVSIAGNRL